MNEQAFLAAIAADPRDWTTRLVYADYLEERGEPDRAAAVRILRYLDDPHFWGFPESVNRALGLPAGSCETANPEPPAGRGQHTEETLAGWVKANRAALERGARRRLQLDGWLDQARAGNVEALLAHPLTRQLLANLVEGKGRPRWEKSISDYCPSRKAVAAAKALMAARLSRRAAAASANLRPAAGRIGAEYLRRLRVRAMTMGETYHREVRALYRSKYAEVVYGRGGSEIEDRERYSKKWHRQYGPARCCCAGARLDSETAPTCVILENFRGTEVARLPLKEGV
jgi:uncharacterized protein (TIGR02996 family)